MRRTFLALSCAAVVLAACGDDTTRMQPPIATPTPQAERPFECPAGMPAYKCEQLQHPNPG